jgi:hypothetical protein
VVAQGWEERLTSRCPPTNDPNLINLEELLEPALAPADSREALPAEALVASAPERRLPW